MAYRKIPTAASVRQRREAVAVTLYAPVENERGWVCNYQISFPKRTVERSSYGVDSLQALMLALEGMQAEVVRAELQGAVALDWQGSKFKMSRRMRAVWKSDT